VWNVRVGRKHHAPYGVFEGMTIFDAGAKVGQAAIGYIPTDQEWRFVNIYEDTATSMRALVEGIDKTGFSRDEPWKMTGSSLPEHETFFFYLQRICNHCTYPGCLAACPRKAIYKRPEDGIVLIDQNRCRGYKKCVEQCPYKKPMYRATTRVSEKCVGCYPRVEGSDPLTEGLPMETRCMSVCPGKIRLQGLVEIDPKTGDWKHDPQNPLYYLVKQARVALPLYPQFGTQPNGYYIPPRWVPREYLEQMFGPGVNGAIDAYTRPPRELLAVLQLFRATQTIIFRYEIREGPKVRDAVIGGQPWEMFDDTVIGYDSQGNEVANVSVLEPFIERPRKYLNSL
jgi:nitrate reductase beta subunit